MAILLSTRIQQAENLWALGLIEENAKNYQLAYDYYSQAHDLIMDCAKLHQRSHKQLRRVNYQLGHYGEWLTDWLLHIFTPFGVFELVSYFAKTAAFKDAICKR